MSDNTVLDAGSGGDTIATDDCSGVKYQIVKLADGTADGTTVVKAGGGVEANALRVTVASDSTGVLSVDDNGGTLTVDDGGSSLTVDNAGTFAVQATATNAGTFAVQDSQVITDNAGFTDGTSKVFMAGYAFDETAGTALTENDAAAARVDSKRAQVFALEDATTRGQRAAISAAGRLSVDASGVAVPITDNSGSLTVDNNGTFAVQSTPKPATSGGLSVIQDLDIDETEDAIKASAGQLYGYYIFNAAASVRYVKIYDATVASVTVGTTTPVITLGIPAGAAANVFSDVGIAFANAITVAATTGVAVADTGAPAANDVVGTFYYA
jgi:hypothetical protein